MTGPEDGVKMERMPVAQDQAYHGGSQPRSGTQKRLNLGAPLQVGKSTVSRNLETNVEETERVRETVDIAPHPKLHKKHEPDGEKSQEKEDGAHEHKHN